MRVRRYEGSTMKEALDQVRADIGADAVILEARRCKRRGLKGILGVLGLRREVRFEVLAAYDLDVEPRDIGGLSGDAERARRRVSRRHEQRDPGRRGDFPSLLREADVAASAASEPVPSGNAVVPEAVTATLSVIARESAARARAATLTPEMGELYAFLLEQDVDESTAYPMVSKIGAASSDIPSEPDVFREWACRAVAAQVQMSGPIQIVPGRRKVVAFTGPTGVGKTTTIAKIAANYALFEKAKVAMITTDTFRIAAISQLRTYAEIIGIPCEAVYSPKEMEDTMARLADVELVLIDTAGRSPNNPTRMYELKNMMDAALPEEVHLVVSCTTRRQDLENLLTRFAGVGFDKVILTKLDESATLGAVINVAAWSGKPVSYLTDGQSVPEDIQAATQSTFAGMALARWRSAGGL